MPQIVTAQSAYQMAEPVVSAIKRNVNETGSLCELPPVLSMVEIKVVLSAELPVELLNGNQLLQLWVESDLSVSWTRCSARASSPCPG